MKNHPKTAKVIAEIEELYKSIPKIREMASLIDAYSVDTCVDCTISFQAQYREDKEASLLENGFYRDYTHDHKDDGGSEYRGYIHGKAPFRAVLVTAGASDYE